MKTLLALSILCFIALSFGYKEEDEDARDDLDNIEERAAEEDDERTNDPSYSSRRRRHYKRRNRHRKPRVAYDRCHRLCDVVRGRLVNCYRVREDFESMTKKEQQRYTRAYYTLTTKEPYKSKYAPFVQVHFTYFGSRIHKKFEFFPWHRWFILKLENMLREIDCRVTVPYWDWSIWSHDPWDRRKIWSGHQGLGGNGKNAGNSAAGGGGCVQTGPFREGNWKTSKGECLRRGFNGKPSDADQVAISLKESTFDKFEIFVRVNLHEGMHCFINGTMCSGNSAEAPEFFFHHGFMDKIWGDYQKKSLTHKNAYYPSIKQKMVQTNFYPGDLIDLSNQPGGVKVMYAEPSNHHAKQIRQFLGSLSMYKLEHLKRMAFSKTPEHAENLFHLSAIERKKAAVLERESRQNVKTYSASAIFARTLSSLERVEGFKIPTIKNDCF